MKWNVWPSELKWQSHLLFPWSLHSQACESICFSAINPYLGHLLTSVNNLCTSWTECELPLSFTLRRQMCFVMFQHCNFPVFQCNKIFFFKIWKNNKIMVFVKEYLIFIHLNMWPDHVKDLCFGLLRFDLAVYEINMQLGNKSAFHLAWGSERKQRWTGGSVIMIQPMCFRRTLKKRTFSRHPWLWHGNQRGSLFNNEQVETQCNGYMHLLCAPVNYLIRTLP